MRVYIAGPYSTDPQAGVTAAIGVAAILADRGHAPYVPHLNHLWHEIAPRPYEEWLRIDMAWLATAEALVRLPGNSPGADREVAMARSLRIPVIEMKPGEPIPPLPGT